jgi:putative SOS response-associated peptidase YedK
MCGRFLLTATPEELQALFGYLDGDAFPPRYNIAPTQPIAVVRHVGGGRRFALVRWGLVPGWVKDPRAFSLIINARAEGIAGRPAYKGAMQYRRCLVPASGFYEWRKLPNGRKQPYLVRPAKGGVVAFAGLWETWLGADGSEIDSGCIITTDANADVAAIHDRMPVVVQPADWERWLDAGANPPPAVADILRPAPDGFFETVPVSTRVNAAANDDPGLIEPAAPTDDEAPPVRTKRPVQPRLL